MFYGVLHILSSTTVFSFLRSQFKYYLIITKDFPEIAPQLYSIILTHTYYFISQHLSQVI